MKPSDLHVFTARFNPIQWTKPNQHYLEWVDNMLSAGVTVHVAEVQYGERDLQCVKDGVDHIPLYMDSFAWAKECAINQAIYRTPEAQYIASIDSDVFFRGTDWPMAVLEALQHYRVLQPWKTCLDLGPNGELLSTHTSFCSAYLDGEPVVPNGKPWWRSDGGPYAYPHCLPGDSLVVPGGDVLAASTRPYEGELIVIRTASGKELTCSPNHPVLTDDGWMPAKLVNVGDDVFRHVRGDGVGGEIDKKQVPARIEDIARSFGERTGVNRTTHLLPDDFDDNRVEQKIAHVWTDRLLPGEAYSGLGEKGRNLVFCDVVLKTQAFYRQSSSDLLLKRFRLSSTAHSSSFSPALTTKLGRRFGEHTGADLLAHRGSSFRTPEFQKSFTTQFGRVARVREALTDVSGDTLVNNAPGVPLIHSDDLGAFRRALAGQVERDKVVECSRRQFSGHLYDLKTKHGYILADSIVTHNSGYAWCYTREMLDRVGGLIEVGGMGSGDHHMALGLVNRIAYSYPIGTSKEYKDMLDLWQMRAMAFVNGRIGMTHEMVEHRFHGAKHNRKYVGRWDQFLRHGFNPLTDLKRNMSGMLEFAGNKPELEREWDQYLRSRNEDANINC